jgi:hypothetical protein
MKSNWIKTVNIALNARSSRKYIATDPRIETRGNTKERRPKERWMYGVKQRMTNHGEREAGTRDGVM